MTQLLQASTISLDRLEAVAHLQEVETLAFFPEWQLDPPNLTDWERESLDRIRVGYFNLLRKPPLLENAVRMAVLYPLLFVAGFYLNPFQARPEQSVTIALEDEAGVRIEGRADVLVFKENLWLMAIESKQAQISLEAGIAQLLTYMLGATQGDSPQTVPVFGLLTNGSHFLFAKLGPVQRTGTQGAEASIQYALSDEFVLRRQQNELYTVLGILKQLAIAIARKG